jgi:hypothetical protein
MFKLMAECSLRKNVVPSICVRSKALFSGIWLEIGNLGSGMNSVNGNISKMDVVNLINEYFSLGINLIIISYCEMHGYFYYPSKISSTFNRYIVSTGGKYTSMSVIPKQVYCPLLTNGDNLFDVIFDCADEIGMKIIMGLGRTEDWTLMNDIYANLIKSPLSLPLDVNQRLGEVIHFSKMMGTELYDLYGWYLCHETQYHDVGANYYDPVSTHLKSLNPHHQVMISPPATYRNRFIGKSLTESLENCNIDIIAIQDALGAGYLSITDKYYFTPAARSQRLLELQKDVYPQIKSAVENAGKIFWVMSEVWEMDGTCPIQGNYGSPYTGDFWSRIYFQLDLASKYSTKVILNEGLLALDFNILSFKFKDSKRNNTAIKFTNDYKSYLRL